jgi:hypothetical protein
MSNRFRIALFSFAVLLLPLLALGQSPTPSPYQGQESREIKSLSPEDVQALLKGEGWGLAKPAELNRYPGPAHVLQLAAPLDLTADQRAAVQQVFDRMHNRATDLGRRVVDLERELDQSFARQTIDEKDMERRVAEIARLLGELRAVHLRAHLETLPLLSQHQVRQYVVLRGYDSGAGDSAMHHPHAPGNAQH